MMWLAAPWRLAVLGVILASCREEQTPHDMGLEREYVLDASASTGLQTSINGVLQEPGSTYECSLVATVSVKAKDQLGRPSAYHCKVRSMRITANAEKLMPFPEGAVILVKPVLGTTFFERDGEAVAPEAEEALNLLFPIEADHEFRSRMLGDYAHRAVGESWSADAEAIAAYLKKQDINVDASTIESRASMHTGSYAGRPCLEVVLEATASMSVDSVENAKIERAVLSLRLKRTISILDRGRTLSEEVLGHGEIAAARDDREVKTTFNFRSQFKRSAPEH